MNTNVEKCHILPLPGWNMPIRRKTYWCIFLEHFKQEAHGPHRSTAWATSSNEQTYEYLITLNRRVKNLYNFLFENCLFVYLFGVFCPTRTFSSIWRRHHFCWRAVILTYAQRLSSEDSLTCHTYIFFLNALTNSIEIIELIFLKKILPLRSSLFYYLFFNHQWSIFLFSFVLQHKWKKELSGITQIAHNPLHYRHGFLRIEWSLFVKRWIPFTKGCFWPSLIEIGPVFLDTIF